MESQIIETAGGRTKVRVYRCGSGEPLVYLHGLWGVFEDDPFLAALAKRYDVYAPMLPGFDGSEGEDSLRKMLDFALHGFDVIDALGISDPLLVGHSLGGMIAAEMAAIAPNDISKLALISPFGLWLDEHPIPDLFAMTFGSWPEVLFTDIEANENTLLRGGDPKDLDFARDFMINNARTLGLAGKVLFPIPDRGLIDRLYRIKAKTRLVWGEQEKLLPWPYAEAFRNELTGAQDVQLVRIPDAAHMSVLEQPEAIADAIGSLGSAQ